MGKELVAYVTMDTLLLAIAANCYTLQLIEIQNRLYSVFEIDEGENTLGYFYPFSNFYTLAQLR